MALNLGQRDLNSNSNSNKNNSNNNTNNKLDLLSQPARSESPSISSPHSASNPASPSAVSPNEPMMSLSVEREEDCEFKRLVCSDDADVQATSDPQVAATNSSPKCEQPDERQQWASTSQPTPDEQHIELRFLVRRREAGALIGKRGSNIKRIREAYKSSMFSIPDTGNGPERVVCIGTNESSLDAILCDLTQLLMEKSPENDEQMELKLLIHSSHAGSIIGVGGQSIKKLRNESKAAIKIYEMCCPLSNERVCAIKAKPPVVVSTIKLIQTILNENPTKGTIKPYDALHFDLNVVDKYGGYTTEEALDMLSQHHHYDPIAFNRQIHDSGYATTNHYAAWRSSEFRESCKLHADANCHRQNRLVSAVIKHENQQTTEPMDNNTQHQQQAVRQCKANDKSSKDQPDCNNESKVSTSQQHQTALYQPARAVRYHPYAQVPINQLDYAQSFNRLGAAANQMCPVNGLNYAPVHYASTGPMVQQHRSSHYIRLPAEMFPNLPERCRHIRPCFCMFPFSLGAPMAHQANVLPNGGQFFHLVKNFNHSRGSAYGYNKRSQ